MKDADSMEDVSNLWEKHKIKKINLHLYYTYKPSKEAITERLLLKEKYMVNNKDKKIVTQNEPWRRYESSVSWSCNKMVIMTTCTVALTLEITELNL